MKIKINKKDLYLLLAFLGGFLYLVQNAWAVQVNRVQSGTAYLDADDTLVTADLTYPVTDQSKCIILLYPRETRLTTDRDQNHLYTAIFEDNGTIMIERAGATQVAYVSWYVIEFEDGVKVVRGITSMKDTTTTKNIDLPQQFDLNKSFIILQLRAPYANPTYTENLFGTAHFIDNDTIQINRGCRSVNTAQTYVYQVVEFSNDANVRTGEVTIAYNATTATASLNPAIADINKAFLITLFRGNNNALDGTEAHIMVRGTITNNTTLTFTREGTSTSTSDTVTVRWFLVELTDSLSRVQKNAPGTPATFSTGTVNVPETINITLNPSVDPTRSFPILRVSGGTGTGTSGGTTYDDFFDDNCVAAELSSTTLSLKRYALATEPGSTTADYASKVDWFVVELAPITVKTPNGGETLVVNEPYEITWRNAASVSNVKIEYSDDNGSTWKTIVNSVPAADKSYTWTVGYDSGGSPILPAYEKETDCLIRISDASNSNLYDVSNGNFTIKSKLKIISPNGGELWYVGDTNRNITWDKWGNFDGTVKLQYSVDAEHNTWTDISGATDLPVNQGSFNWNPLPLEASGKTVKVRIVSNTYPNDVFDTSDNDFEIRGNITVNKPNASSEWPTGYPNDIEWTLNSNTTSVDIYYSLDNGQTYNLIVQGTNAKNVDDTHGKYSWTPPLDKASNFSKIKVVDHSDADVFGISETFKIIPSIKVISPNGGEIWKVDQSKKIEWEVYPATGIQYVTIKYCTDFTTNKTWQVVQGGAQVDASLGEFSWTVPDAITIGATAGIRIEKYLDANIYDESDGPFQIKGDITVIQPQAGIKIPAHQNFVISWTPHGSLSEKYGNNFRIAYSNNGGVSYTTIYTGINASLGEKVWYSTDIPLDNLGQPDSRIKIGLIGDDEPPNGVYGESESFSIRGNITVTYPNGGEIFNIGDHCVIKWDAYPSGYGALGTVRIAYSKNSGNDGYPDSQVIVTGIDASSGTTGYDWQIPDADLLYNTIRIQVRLAVDPTGEVKDESDYDFTIKGNLDLTRPSENPNDPALTWLCGTQEAITWIRNGSSMGAVDIYFSRNNGEDNYIGVIDASGTIPSGNQSYIWTIPSLYDPEHPEKWPFKTGDNGINLQIRIKLVSHDDPSGVYSISQQPLTIKSRFIDLVPNGGIITVGEPFNITWTTQGEVGTVNIKYSTDGGNTFSGIIVLGVTNAEGYYWNPVNCPVDNDIRIRVESAVYPNDIYLVSQNNIDAKGKIEITSPSADNRGENGLIPTETHRITWITNGGVGSDIGVVDLYYAQDGVNFGTPFAQVDTAVQNYYDWTVPSPTSLPVSTAKIKIVDNSDSSVFDISDAFDIRGKFWNGTTNHALIEPNGGEVYYVGGTIRIKWKYKGNIGQSELYYDTNEGNNGYPNFIATVNHNQNESEGVCYYDWPVPETAGTKYRVKLKAVSDAYCYANSLGNFVIKGNLNLTSPGRNPENPEVWYVDQTNPISWTMQGGISQVDLLLDTDGDLDFDDFVIASGIGGGSSPYQWTISQENDRVAVTSDNCRVRVRDHNDPTVYSSSTNSFYIKPKVFIGEIVGSPWTVEEQKTITWTKTGKVSQLNLYYSSQGQDGPWNLQISGINAEAGSVLWTIPQTAVSWGNAVLKLVRVEGGQEDNYVISKSQNFSIKGKINVTYPTTAQTYNVLQTGQIQWYVVGAVGNVDIKYNTNYQNNYPDEDWANFPGATNIPPDYCSNPEHPYYVFNIPSETAPYVKIRVVESQHPEVFGPPMAGSPTHKFKGSIFFDQPPGNPSTRNQTIVIGPTPHTIHWSLVGTFSGLRAYYKKIGDSSWTQIGSDLPGTATQTNYTPIDSDITLPDGSNKVLFRVEDIADPQNVYAETPVNEGNTVKGYLEILEPITPQEFTVGSTTQVKWKKYGNIGNLKFELWDGTQWLNNAGGSNLPDSYPCGQSGEGGVVLVPAWTVPDKIGTGRKIRVTSLTYPELTSTTGEFTIKGSFKSIVTPQVWYVGEDHLIEWEANGSMASVKIELYNGVSWATIEANYNNNGQGLNNGYNSYLWSASSPLQQQRSSNCKIRITSNQNPDVYIETGNFTIKPKIVVDTPTQPWIAETNNNQISWQTIPPPTTNVDIILIDNNNGQGYPVTLASNIPKNSSPYVSSVTLPATLTNSAKIRVRDSSFPDFVYGDSGTFKIIGAIIMDPVDNTPNANSNWEVESVQNITWSHKGNLGQVNIRYRYDGGNYSSPINSTPIDVTAHSYAWQIPMIISENVQVKIESVNNPTEEYVESPIFKIKGKFILNEPGTLICGEPYNIQWTQPEAQKDLITDVILEFYNGTEWSYVNPTSPYTVPNTGSYAWTVPTNTRGTTCRIRISDPDNPGAKDETENFAVLPTLNVTSPTSTTKWTIGTTGNFINFTVTGPVNAVKIDYSKDNGDSYTYTIVSNYTINHQSGTGNYSYNWTIPTDKDILTEHIEGQEKKARIKVVDTSLSTIYGLSGLFMVKSTITVNKPSAADILKVGEAFNIEWSTPCSGEADMGNVKIQFSKTGSAPWTDVATVRFDASPYTGWAPPPDGITDNQKTAKIRIIQLNNTEVYDDSDGFEIEGKIRLDSPDLDEPVWYVSDTQQIKWTPTGNFSYVRIEYSKDGGETWVYPPIANSYSNPPHGQQGSYDWTIPDSIGNNLRVKITALNDPDVKAISSRPFTIKGKLTLIAPNGRDIWYVNETNRKVRWQATGSIETVRIELSKNNGGTWIELISNAPAGPGAGEYTLLSVPDAISDQCLIRISDTKDPEVKDVSDEVFSIKGRLYVEKPDGSERWIVNSSGHEIRWSMDGSIQNVKITYSADGGPFNNVIVSSTPASNYSYTWNNLPTHVGKYRIKIADVNDEENVYAISNEFKIVGQISVVKPAGGEKLRVGSDFKIEWAKIGDFANVRIEYSTNGGQTYDYQIVESTPADNLYYWWTNISSSTVSPNVVLKITDASDIQTYAVSNPFKIQGIFNITSPDGGEVWQVDSDQTITWTTVGNISKVNLYYSTNGGDTWELIAQEIPNTGSKSWKVPDAISNYCRVKVVDSNDMESWDTSAGNFKICGALRITSPNTGTESWLVGTEQSITWEVTGSISRIKLEYSVDGGSYEGIPGADNLPAQDKSFNWTIPDRLSSQVRVKITNKDDTTVFDTSDYPFTITGKLIVTSPTSADTWYVQEQRTISWQKIGTIPTVNLQYSIGGGEYQNIEDGQGVSGNSFNWIVPDAISTQVKIRVVNADSSKPTIPGVSDLFTIKGKLLITNPQLSDIWEVGKQKDITWTRIGSIGTVKLEYDYGNGFILIPGAGNIDSSLLKFTWTIPNTISNNVVVKITPNIETEAEPNTSPSFKIAADIELTSPVGGEIWIVDEERPITWDKTGDIDSIVLKYDINEGLGGYPYTIATRPASDRSYTWTVPDKIGDKVRVRIEDANVNSSTLPDESGNFTIRGAIGITQPRGIGPNKKVWLCETQENIAFTIHGSIANVQIRYSIDGGGSYPDSRIIVNSFPVGEVPPGGKNLTYTWTIPYETTTRAKIKIINLADSNVFDESDEFVIRGGFVFIHPTSGERWLAMSSKTIEWDTLGIINYVYIQYSLNDGVNWFFVNDGSPIQNLERYNWTVPEQVTNQARIKIVDTNDPDAKQISERFVIHGALTIIKPNGQEKFKVGQSDSSTKIVWSRVGTISAVDLALSANGQNGDYVTFATNVPASNLEYPWSVPTNVVSNNCFIRIRDSNDPLVEDYSDLAFKIMENITVTRPNGTERFVVDEQEEVKWETTSFPNQTNFVIIKYSTEPPYTNWITVASKTENDGSYLWTVPPTISNTCRIRISSYDDDADAYDISDGDFKIQGKITITQPIGGEKWGCATQQLIKWNWKGNISKVDIDYYNGSNWVAIDGAQNYNNIGEYEWTIPNIATEQARVRVKDHNDPTNVYDTSSPFKIMPRVVVQVPNGAEVWYAGSNATILWAKYGPASFDTVKIDYSVDDPEFNNPHSITTSTPNDGSFDWLNIPAEAVSGKVRIRVAHPSDPDVFDISDNDFRIRAQFNISVPNGGQKWTVGNKYNIVWSQIGNTQGVKFTYYRQTNPAINQTFTLTSNYGTGTYSYEWTVPDFIYNDLLMKIQDPNDVDAYDISDATFKIMPGFTVISPDAINDPEGSKWYVGDPATIRWDYTGTVGDVGIYYSVAGGIEGSWIPLTSVPAQNKSWTWPSVPDQITAQLKIKVASANDPDAYGVSNGMSKIRAKFSLSAPSGGEELIVGNTFRILWSNTGTVNKVDLHYSKDNFQTSVPIENGINIDNTGQFDWTIPDDISHTVKVRVKSHTDDDAYAISGAFRIKGNIWVKQPSRDVSWEIGKSYNISWGWIGTIPEVKITYSVNGLDGPFKPIKENYGTPDDGIVGNGSGSGGSNSEYSYSWTIPDEATGNALIRITDARESENDIVATSEEFNLVGYILVKTPSLPGIRMAVASNYTIRWEWGGTMPKVKITYSTNGDTGPFVPIQENYETPNDGIVANGTGSGGPGSEYSYVWTVPDSISTNCKIKIADARPDLEDTVFDVSDNTFKIQGAFTLITPALELNDNGTPNNPDDDFYECRWVTNEVRTISWDTFGTISKVDLTYAKDFDKDGDIDDADFANEIPMVNGTNIDNVGYFNWTVPNERLPDPPYYVNVKIRVYDHNDHEVYVEGPTPVGGVDTLKIDYYKITWDIRDLITNQPIAGLRVYDTAGDGWSDWTAQGLVSPVSHWVPAGYRRAEWTHKDYGPISEEYLVGWDPDARVWRKDRTIYRTMETLVVHIWRAYSEFAYDVERDKLDITSWLERDGSMVPGALIIDVNIFDGATRIKRKTILVDDVNKKHYYYEDIPSSVKLWIGDRLGEVRTMEDLFRDCQPYKIDEKDIPPDFAGFFQQSWSPTRYTKEGEEYQTLVPGRVYAVTTYMGLGTGAVFTTPVSFTVTIPSKMASMEQAVKDMKETVTSTMDKPISEMSMELQTVIKEKLDAQTTIIENKMTEQTQLIQSATEEMKETIREAMVSFENSVSESITLLRSSAEVAEEAAGLLETTALRYSWNAVVYPDPALVGDKITLTVQGPSTVEIGGKTIRPMPVLDIYNWENKKIIDSVVLIQTAPGVYTYQFEADSRFAPGKAYSYVVSDQVTGGMVAGSGMVESVGITTVAGLAAAAPEAERAAKKALDAIKAVEAVVVSGENINIALTLKNLKESVDALPQIVAKEGPSAVITQTINDIAERIKRLAGEEGYDLRELIGEALGESPTIKDVRSKTDAISSIVDLLLQLFEAKFGGVDSPIVSTYIQPGSIVFRIVAVNPSKFKTQKIPVKSYLPPEVKPEDVIDTGGLNLEYDIDQKLWYVYKDDLELAPGEMRVFNVEVKDVWIIPLDKINELRQRTEQILDKLKETDYYNSAKEIADSINTRLDRIITSQSDESLSRQQHIGIYRQNLTVLEEIKEDLARLERIVVTAGGPPAPEMLAKTKIKAEEPTKTMTWMVIFLIMIFTGLLAGVFFFTWHRQAKISKEEIISAKKSAFPETTSEEKPPEEEKGGS